MAHWRHIRTSRRKEKACASSAAPPSIQAGGPGWSRCSHLPAALTGIANDPQAFFGWISSTPLQRLTIRGGGTNPNRWVSTSLMIYGGPVTVPGPLPLAGALAAFGWGRRLRGRISQARR